MMMVLFRIGLATFYIGFLLNIFFLSAGRFALILAVSVYIFSQRNYTVNTLELKIIFSQNFNNREILKQIEGINLTPWDGHMSTFIIAKEHCR
jgi:CPA2 family monovalent cation:H+ antiporter-2